MGNVVFFDLDETLMVEEPAAAAAFLATAQRAAAIYDLDEDLWRSPPEHGRASCGGRRRPTGTACAWASAHGRALVPLRG